MRKQWRCDNSKGRSNTSRKKDANRACKIFIPALPLFLRITIDDGGTLPESTASLASKPDRLFGYRAAFSLASRAGKALVKHCALSFPFLLLNYEKIYKKLVACTISLRITSYRHKKQ